jgi:hypothetical protein
MKKLMTAIVFIFFLFTAHAQETTPQLLKGPATWEFERFALPPVFAPAFPYKGAEELRFAPGMFKKEAGDYFSYAFAAQLDSVSSFSKDDLQNYLLTYFKGLCMATARDRKLVIDDTKIAVSIEKKKSMSNIYKASLDVFGVFADGSPVKLNAEIEVIKDSRYNKFYLLFIASPREKTDPVWKDLYKIRQDFVMPGYK